MVADAAGGAEDGGDVGDVLGWEECAAGEGEEAVGDVGDCADGEVGLEAGEGAGLGGGGEARADFVEVGGGFEIERGACAGGGLAVRGEAFDDLWVFEGGEAFLVHQAGPSGVIWAAV